MRFRHVDAEESCTQLVRAYTVRVSVVRVTGAARSPPLAPSLPARTTSGRSPS